MTTGCETVASCVGCACGGTMLDWTAVDCSAEFVTGAADLEASKGEPLFTSCGKVSAGADAPLSCARTGVEPIARTAAIAVRARGERMSACVMPGIMRVDPKELPPRPPIQDKTTARMRRTDTWASRRCICLVGAQQRVHLAFTENRPGTHEYTAGSTP